MAQPDLLRLIELQKFLIEFQGIKRMVRVPGTANKWEDDAQHSYTLAMAAWLLVRQFPRLNPNKVIQYALAHDLVEVYAGDTFFYDDVAVQTKATREAEAAVRIASEWPDFPELNQAIEEYETKATPEACFVYALDKIMPIILVYLDKGSLWQEEHITYSMLKEKEKEKVALSPEIDTYYQQLLKMLDKTPEYFYEGGV